MSTDRGIVLAKSLAIVGFLGLLMMTYWLRSEVLGLSRIHFSADQKRSELEQQQFRDSFPDRQKRHEVELRNYEIQAAHYQKMLALYETDLEEYARLTKDTLEPPQLAQRPEPPMAPAVEEEFRAFQREFVARRYRYFQVSEWGNWIACLSALLLVGGLLYLLMFDLQGNRLYYLMTLALSFVFLIGPSLQSVMSALMGLMNGPSLY